MSKPLVHSLYTSPMSGEAIEARSFELIDLALPHPPFAADEWQVVRRVVHTTGDLSLADSVRFSPEAVSSGVAALRRGCRIVVDSRMIRAGLSLARLRSAFPRYGPQHLLCHVADPDVAREAGRAGQPRSLFALRKARPSLDGAIAVFGNSPVALLELNRLVVEEGVKPALVIGLPVGFVHVVEAKDELLSVGVPYLTIAGRRGGSPLAVAAVHALCGLAAAAPREAGARGEKVAVVLMGHGSRLPDAGRDMEEVAGRLRGVGGYDLVEVCYMSQVGPTFDEAIDRCAAAGAGTAVVLPYFLHAGVHLQEDIPAMISEKARKLPGLKLLLGKHLGFDETLVDLVQLRVGESLAAAGRGP
ncbi:MAG: precorrin-8X methylmutase [Myxococcaceae bacterium]